MNKFLKYALSVFLVTLFFTLACWAGGRAIYIMTEKWEISRQSEVY